MMIYMLAMLLLSTAAAGLNPLSQPVQRVDVGSGNSIVLHVPTDDAIMEAVMQKGHKMALDCLLYTSPSPRDRQKSRMPSSA